MLGDRDGSTSSAQATDAVLEHDVCRGFDRAVLAEYMC